MAEKVAIFLDVENLSGWLKADGGEALLERANELGRVVVRRAYWDLNKFQAQTKPKLALSAANTSRFSVSHSKKRKDIAVRKA
ncbi:MULTISPECIES: hypothetical protein, partial [unclassified Microcystis]|uniref:hypothetical protein n=1 Tax=unclassified Microcystis TaxID=2643300 RepID=UPI00257A2A2A